MFGFGGGNYGGPGEGVGGGPGGPGGAGKNGLGSGSSNKGVSDGGKDKDRSVSKSPSDKEGDRSLSGRTASPGSGSMERARSVDRAGVTGYAGNSKTHEQDIAERHAERESFVDRALAAGGRLSTNVEGMTAYDESARKARQIGGVIDQTNVALRSNDLMSHFPMESTWDTRFRPNIQTPVASARQYEITPNALAAGGAKPIDSTADLGRYRAVDTFTHGPASFSDIKHEMDLEALNNGAAPGLAGHFSYNPRTGQIERVSETDGMSPSERNAQGKEGSNSGPGNPSASGSAPGKGGRVGFGSVGADSKEGDRSLSVGVDPSRFGGRSTPTGFGADAKEGDRSLSTGIDPSRFGPTRGFGAAMGEIDRASQARAAERTSMATYDAAVANTAANAQRADMAPAARAAENISMRDMATWGKQVKSVVEAGPGWTTVELNDGTVERRAGDRAARNFNPGNMMAGPFTDSMGAIGNDFATPADIAAGRKRGFAVFGSKEEGIAAQAGWYAKEAKKNPNMTLGQAISKYAPEFENDTRAYTAALAAAGGISADTKLSDINQDQMTSIISAQHGVEGNTGYKMAEVSPRTKDYGDVRSYPDNATQFASTYLGKNTKQAQVDYFGSVPQKGGYAAANEKALKDQESVRTASAEEGDTSPQSASYTPDPSLTEFPDRPRSNTEKFMAGALDIGAGLIPGVGLGVGLINGGLSLTGSRTIGDRIVDAVVTGDGKYTPRELGDPNRPTVVADATTVPATQKTVPTVDSFVDSYLSPPDATKYMTPHQRYDLNRNTYAGV